MADADESAASLPRPALRWGWAALASCIWTGCSPETFSVLLALEDERGAPLADGWAEVDGRRVEADRRGVVALRDLRHPVLALAGGPDHIAEPVPVGRDDSGLPMPVRLLERGDRAVLHFGGDVMFGRRYLDPTEGPALLGAGQVEADARALVEPLAAAFAAADLSMVNVESVVGDADLADAYPSKRWLLQSPPASIAGLERLGVDGVVLANNHLYDWMEAGVTSTLDAFAARGMPTTGAGATAADAERPLVLQAGGLEIGVLARTSVDGNWVNEQYPRDEEAVPEDLDPAATALWERRSWGWTSRDGAVGVETEARRLGSAWQRIRAIESDLDEADAADLWRSARVVYPELQDWVARRGHGGAARWSAADTPDAITQLAGEVDFVVVQLHMGFQFSEVPADAARDAAHAAVAAGADLVVLHHPHVLQGLEWIDGVPVVYSLGNLLFDQNFLSTFGGGMLRVVVDGEGAIDQVRFIPTWLDNYVPTPVTGFLGDRVLHQMWERSMQRRTAVRTPEGVIVPLATDPTDPEPARPGHVEEEHNTLRFVSANPAPQVRAFALDGAAAVPVPDGLLLQTPLPDGRGLEVGRALLGLGHFEDEDTDRDGREWVGWKRYGADAHITLDDSEDGVAALELIGRPDRARTTARMLARAPIPIHRVYGDVGEELDGAARYSVRLRAWARQETDLGLVRIALYNFDDTNPAAPPESTLITEHLLPFSVPPDTWTTVELELPDDALTNADGLRANFALVYLSATQAQRRSSVLRIDDVELIEWRSASRGAGGWERIDFLRGGFGPIDAVTLSWDGQ